jgi:hypothetical protein
LHQTIRRLKHQTKIFVGNLLGRVLSRQYARGQGPAKRLVSVFSEQSDLMGLQQNIVLPPVSLKRAHPDYFLDGEVESKYQNLIMRGEGFTERASVISAQNVDVSFPTSMHRIGNKILNEVLPAPYLLANPKYYYALESMPFKRKHQFDDGVLLSMPLHHNFYHWMIEMLPRLNCYDRCPNLHRSPILVPKTAPKFVSESLMLSGYQSKVIFMEDGVYNFKTLHMLSRLASMTEVSPDALEWLNQKFSNAASTAISPKRIYVSRSDAKIRYVSNEYQLSDVLSEFGFEILVMSGLSLADQINAFRSADCIIGPHGAAFANLTFSKPGSVFIEMFSKGHYSPSYNRICRIRGIKYGFLVGEPTGIGGFSVDSDQLRAILFRALHSPA